MDPGAERPPAQDVLPTSPPVVTTDQPSSGPEVVAAAPANPEETRETPRDQRAELKEQVEALRGKLEKQKDDQVTAAELARLEKELADLDTAGLPQKPAKPSSGPSGTQTPGGTQTPPEEPSLWDSITGKGSEGVQSVVGFFVAAYYYLFKDGYSLDSAWASAKAKVGSWFGAEPATAEGGDEDVHMDDETDEAAEDPESEDEESPSKDEAQEKGKKKRSLKAPKKQPSKAKKPPEQAREKGPYSGPQRINHRVESAKRNFSLIPYTGALEQVLHFEGARVSSGTGLRGKHGAHDGFDVPLEYGQPIQWASTLPGVFERKGYSATAGNFVTLSFICPKTQQVVYMNICHLAKTSPLSDGQVLSKGTVLGLAGDTGRVRSSQKKTPENPHPGTHAHVSFRTESPRLKTGKLVNPYWYIGG